MNFVDLVKSFPTNIDTQYLLLKIGVDRAENGPLQVHLVFQPWDLIFTEPPRPCRSNRGLRPETTTRRTASHRKPRCLTRTSTSSCRTILSWMSQSNGRCRGHHQRTCTRRTRPQPLSPDLIIEDLDTILWWDLFEVRLRLNRRQFCR